MSGRKTCALVTGGTGFVGSRLVRRLVAEDFDVRVVVRPGSNLRELAPVVGKIALMEHDGATEDLVRGVAEAPPDIVFHLASYFVAEHRPEHVGRLMDSNLRFGAQLLEAMALNGARLLVNAGTAWQHFGTSAYRPVCLYAATKQAFEAVLEFYIDAHALRAITLKLFDTYGPGDPRPKLLSLLQKATATGAPLDLSPGEQLINPVYIDDVVEAFVLAGKRLLDGAPAGKEEYAVSSRHPLSVREFAAAYASASGRGLELRWCAQPYRAREVMVPWNTGASLPGWSPKVTLEEGIRRIAGCAPPGESQ